MADSKKYYYLKLKENFFESDSMILLENMADGYLYSNILLKLYLRSLKDDGRLMLNGAIPYNSQMLASVTRHQVGTVEKALKIFKELGLIEMLDSGAIYMMNIQDFIGKSSSEADRKRAYRTRIEEEKASGQITGQMSRQISDKHPDKTPPEIEIEKEIENRDKYIVEQSPTTYPFRTVIEYLNERSGKSYRYSGKATKRHIKARFEEGFSLEDFKRVIDWKVAEWTGTDMEKYLRPETLFGTKFESYLQEAPAPRKPDSKEPEEKRIDLWSEE